MCVCVYIYIDRYIRTYVCVCVFIFYKNRIRMTLSLFPFL